MSHSDLPDFHLFLVVCDHSDHSHSPTLGPGLHWKQWALEPSAAEGHYGKIVFSEFCCCVDDIWWVIRHCQVIWLRCRLFVFDSNLSSFHVAGSSRCVGRDCCSWVSWGQNCGYPSWSECHSGVRCRCKFVVGRWISGSSSGSVDLYILYYYYYYINLYQYLLLLLWWYTDILFNCSI